MKNVNMEKKKNLPVPDEPVCLPRKLTDVGGFSYCSLCAVSLTQLYDDEWNKDFRKAALETILQHLKVPKQVCDSVRAIADGNGIDDPKPYADELLTDPCLHESGIPVITDLVTLSISHGCYDARLRTLVKHIAWHLRVSWDHIEEVESILAETLEAKQYEMSEEEANEKKKKSRNQKIKRIALVSLATVGGGALIGLTGGLAAPLVAAGAGAIIGGAGAAALGTTAGVAIIGSLFGVAGAGLAGHKMNKRFGAIEEFKFEPMVSGGALQRASVAKQLHITIAVTGWLSNTMQDVKIPWKNLAESQEIYCLRYESKHLSILGNAIEYFLSGAVSMATQEALKYTVFSAILSAIAWPSALLSAANVIDNPWGVCLQRSVATGKELAEALLAREQGNRPVTLIGYSLGARVIFYCLEEMCKRKCCQGIIEDVILLGAPVPGDTKTWQKFGKIISGKIINGYSKADWLLKFLYRTSSVQLSVAGLQPIKWDNRRMHNIDLSDIVGGHGAYLKELDTIMKVVGVRTKEDIVKQSVTSGTMIARDDISYTSSEGEDSDSEKRDKRHRKYSKQKRHSGKQNSKDEPIEAESQEKSLDGGKNSDSNPGSLSSELQEETGSIQSNQEPISGELQEETGSIQSNTDSLSGEMKEGTESNQSVPESLSGEMQEETGLNQPNPDLIPMKPLLNESQIADITNDIQEKLKIKMSEKSENADVEKDVENNNETSQDTSEKSQQIKEKGLEKSMPDNKLLSETKEPDEKVEKTDQ